MSRLRVHRAGPLLTVQDLGRPGWAHLGVSRSGAADRAALVRANRLVGNPDGAAGLEATLRGPVLEAEGNLRLAVTGAGDDLVLPLPAGARRRLPDPAGARLYVAVAGGLDVPPVLGSRSRDVLAGLGPPPLRDGDVLPVGPAAGAPTPDLPPVAPARPARGAVLTLLPGPWPDLVDRSALPAVYRVDPRSNRVGVRLAGPRLGPPAGEQPSAGLVPGAVQVPPDGQPIVLLADHPTTGGYPVLGVVPPDQLATVAQLRPGDQVTLAGWPARSG